MSAAAPIALAGTEPVLALKNVAAGYGGVRILNDVNLIVGRNEIVSVLGRNGVGKTTLVNTVFNLGPEISGDIRLFGRETGGLPSYRIARLGMALVPQGRGLFPNLSVAESLRLATLWKGQRARKWTLERIYDSFPRLAERRHLSSSALSGGERQLLAIARALLTQAEFLVLDEPSEGLAPMAIEEVVSANIRKLGEEGLTVLLVEQNVPLALRVATRAVVLARGTVVYDGLAADLVKDTALMREHLGV